ncbi:hypothetical protein M8818_003082 [Zalaria obscura]|uniref:Uncharacterized protein n=1 Tax=Zalaria obscura TaxID=2024903 RepID=A0ACC3SGF0_9PEZI
MMRSRTAVASAGVEAGSGTSKLFWSVFKNCSSRTLSPSSEPWEPRELGRLDPVDTLSEAALRVVSFATFRCVTVGTATSSLAGDTSSKTPALVGESIEKAALADLFGTFNPLHSEPSSTDSDFDCTSELGSTLVQEDCWL